MEKLYLQTLKWLQKKTNKKTNKKLAQFKIVSSNIVPN